MFMLHPIGDVQIVGTSEIFRTHRRILFATEPVSRRHTRATVLVNMTTHAHRTVHRFPQKREQRMTERALREELQPPRKQKLHLLKTHGLTSADGDADGNPNPAGVGGSSPGDKGSPGAASLWGLFTTRGGKAKPDTNTKGAGMLEPGSLGKSSADGECWRKPSQPITRLVFPSHGRSRFGIELWIPATLTVDRSSAIFLS